jgi:Glycosyltransferase family 87
MARMAARFLRPFADRRFRLLVWAVLGVTGWVGLILLGATLLAQQPPHAGFDLTLILDAGRRVSAGQSPYLAGAVGGGTQVESLFYSYPPPVAQAASLLGGLDDAVVLAAMGVLATLGLGAVAAGLAGIGRVRAVDVAIPTLALAPFIYPFAIALLFGNVDAWYPLAYGAILVSVLGGSSRWRIGGGIALALVTVAKLQPGALLLWLAIAGLGLRRASWNEGGPGEGGRWPAAWTSLAAAVATLAVVVGASLAVGGIGPWQDYVGVLRAGGGVDLVSPLNIGPASQLALLLGDPSLAARLAPLFAVAALAGIAIAARWARPPAASLAIAAVLSLLVLPITWFHYPVALVPFAVWAGVAAQGSERVGLVGGLVALALVVAALAIVAPVIVWLAAGLVVAAVAAVPIRTVGRSPVLPATTPAEG